MAESNDPVFTLLMTRHTSLFVWFSVDGLLILYVFFVDISLRYRILGASLMNIPVCLRIAL